ncbi:lipopolysaccharide biosynthesis protein [Aurantiacibacter aquimixticola]|uniref:lipopolysaccharide biosynthesis protein n=1 Tax=Aurantiacibacter aquimixticola TaxID=1958945 RepID=UPI00140279F3|nr:hypothetical protein [Aurantiacibacter aquimixticola]
MKSNGFNSRGRRWKAFRAVRVLVAEVSRHGTALSSLLITGSAVAAGFAVTFLIGRNFGASATGQYALMTQTAMLLAVLGLAGLDVSAVRHFARSVALKRKLSARSLFTVTGIAACLVLIVCAALFLGGSVAWRALFADILPSDFLLLLCILIVGRAGARFFGAVLRSRHSFVFGQLVSTLLIPVCAGLALLTGLADNVREAMWATALGGILATAIGSVGALRHVSRGQNTVSIALRPVLASSLPLWGVGVIQSVADWYGLAVAAHALGAEETGYFRVAVQIAAVIQITTMALSSVYSAQISTAFHDSDRHAAAKIAATAIRLSAIIAIPLGVGLLAFGAILLRQIGPEFEAAYPALVILTLGQIAIALTGPSGLVLAMSGNERTNLLITLASAVLLLLSVPIAAAWTGLPGIAACVCVAGIARNIVAYFVVLRRERIEIWRGIAKPK